MMLSSKPTQYHPSQALRWTFTGLSPHKGKRAPMQNIFYVARLQGAQAVGSPDLRLATVLPKASSPR